jgi:hypothetical protein
MKKHLIIGGAAVAASILWLSMDNAGSSITKQIQKEKVKPSKVTSVQSLNRPRRYRVSANRVEGTSLTQEELVGKFDLSKLPPELLMIAGITENGKKLSYNDRMDAIESLTKTLDAETIEFLRAFLRVPFSEETGMTAIGYNAVKNDVLEVLLRQDVLIDGIGNDLVEMYRASESDDMWRDYCVQFMTDYYTQAKVLQNPDNMQLIESELAEIESSLFAGVKETNLTIAGTALITLDNISRVDERVNINEAVRVATEMATDSSVPDFNRITALRICAKHGETDSIRDSVTEIVQIGESTPLRIVAAKTLGDIGTLEDVTLLEELKASTEDKILLNVIDTAIAKLSGNNG